MWKYWTIIVLALFSGLVSLIGLPPALDSVLGIILAILIMATTFISARDYFVARSFLEEIRQAEMRDKNGYNKDSSVVKVNVQPGDNTTEELGDVGNS